MDQTTPEERLRARAAYYGVVTLMDANVGAILDALEATGFGGDTVLVYTTDHGEMASEHDGMWLKRTFYEGAVSVPLIFSAPGLIRQNTQVDAVTSLMDVGPTLINLAGAEPLPDASGRSLVGFLGEDGSATSWPDTAYAECRTPVWSRMVRRGPWKLNYYAGYDRPQLFNLDQDPDEFHDRADDPSCREIVRELTTAVLEGWSADFCEQRHARNKLWRNYVRRWWKPTRRNRTSFLWEGFDPSLPGAR